jgi:Secretion system C-terminal sorting domain/CARDB
MKKRLLLNIGVYLIGLLLISSPIKAQGVVSVDFNGSVTGHTATIVYVIDGKVNATTYIGRAILFEARGLETPGQLVTSKEVVTYFGINGRPFPADFTNSFNSLIDAGRRPGIGNITYLETTNQTAREIIKEGYRIKDLNTSYNVLNIGGCNCSSLSRQLITIAEQYDRFTPLVRRVLEAGYSPGEHQGQFITPIKKAFTDYNGSKPAWGFTYDNGGSFIRGITGNWENAPAYRSYFPNFDKSFPRAPQDEAIETQIYYGPWPTPSSNKELKVETKGLSGNQFSYNILTNPTDGYYTSNYIDFFTANNEIKYQFSTLGSSGTFNLPPDITKIQFTGKNADYKATLNLPTFGGIDFTNLSVAGLDVDINTGLINFILKGDQTSGSQTNLKNKASYYKKVFLQALTVPTNEWFVSLDINPAPTATASTAFKQTDLADLFFKADVDLKKDMFTYFYNGQGDVSVIAKWLQILAANNSTMLNSLVTRGVNLVPNLTIRGVIIPQIAPNDQVTGKLNIENAFYDVNITFPNASLNTGGAALSAAETSFLNTNWGTFVGWLNTRKVTVASVLRDRINNGVITNYSNLKDILPTLVAAKWYKDAPVSVVPNKQYANIIDQKLTGTLAPGLNLTQAVAWNQTYWNGQANQTLGNISFSVPSGTNNITGSVTITGGVDLYNMSLANNAMSAAKSARNTQVVTSTFVNESGKAYVNGGSATQNLSNLAMDNIFIEPSVRNVPSGTYASDESLNFSFDIRNMGLVRSPNPIDIRLNITNIVTGATTVYTLTYSDTIGVNGTANLGFSLSNWAPSRYRIFLVADPNNAVKESNEFDNNIAKEFIVLQDVACTGGISFTAAINSNTLDLTSCKVTLQGGTVTLTGNGNITALHNGVFLKDGFKYTATATSTLKAKSVFSYTNTASNLYGRSTSAGIIQNDLLPTNEQGLAAQNDIQLKNTKTQIRQRAETVIQLSELSNEQRHYMQKLEYTSVYSIQESAVTPKIIENIPPDDIVRLRNQKDNIKQLVIITNVNEAAQLGDFWGLSPNPTNGIFSIQFKANVEEVIAITLTDVNGKGKQLLGNYRVKKGNSSRSFSINDLPDGFYVIELVTQTGIHSSKVLVKKK